MAELAAEKCLAAHRAGKAFTLEHPGRSIALKLDSWKQLRGEPGVFTIFHHHCMFAPCVKQKYQVLITNIEPMIDAVGMLCGGTGPDAICSRT
eukprot:15311112-Heterocapsa_arctica.AAC.1